MWYRAHHISDITLSLYRFLHPASFLEDNPSNASNKLKLQFSPIIFWIVMHIHLKSQVCCSLIIVYYIYWHHIRLHYIQALTFDCRSDFVVDNLVDHLSNHKILQSSIHLFFNNFYFYSETISDLKCYLLWNKFYLWSEIFLISFHLLESNRQML